MVRATVGTMEIPYGGEFSIGGLSVMLYRAEGTMFIFRKPPQGSRTGTRYGGLGSTVYLAAGGDTCVRLNGKGCSEFIEERGEV